jgi:hypothetical protein
MPRHTDTPQKKGQPKLKGTPSLICSSFHPFPAESIGLGMHSIGRIQLFRLVLAKKPLRTGTTFLSPQSGQAGFAFSR